MCYERPKNDLSGYQLCSAPFFINQCFTDKLFIERCKRTFVNPHKINSKRNTVDDRHVPSQKKHNNQKNNNFPTTWKTEQTQIKNTAKRNKAQTSYKNASLKDTLK